MKNLLTFLFVILTYNCLGQCGLEVKKVTVFKDATVFVEKEGVCDSQNKTIELTQPFQSKMQGKIVRIGNTSKKVVNDNVFLGTVEIEAPGNKVISKQSTQYIKKDIPLSSIEQILSINKGKKIKLYTNGLKIEGVLYSLESLTNANQIRDKLILIKREEDWKIVKLSELESFDFIDSPELFKESKNLKFSVTLEKDTTNQLIKFSYLRKGITWTPSYSISIESDNKLSISLNANILNDVETLNKVDMNLAVGVPIFKYSNIESPLLSKDRVFTFTNKLEKLSNDPKALNRNSIMTQRSNHDYLNFSETYDDKLSPLSNKEDDDDIFLYQLKHISLEQGDRVNYNITKFKTDYTDIFSIDLPSNNDFVAKKRSKYIGPLDVWHSIKFKNKSNLPLTTGTAFFKKHKESTASLIPISQGQLDYTPIGGSCILKTSVALNIIVNQSEKQLSKEKDEKIGYGYLVRVKGEIEIVNLKGEEVDILVNRSIQALNLIKSSEKWRTSQSFNYLYEGNQTNNIQWNISLKSNEKKVITYEYIAHIN